jgi:hypothetical protein
LGGIFGLMTGFAFFSSLVCGVVSSLESAGLSSGLMGFIGFILGLMTGFAAFFSSVSVSSVGFTGDFSLGLMTALLVFSWLVWGFILGLNTGLGDGFSPVSSELSGEVVAVFWGLGLKTGFALTD